MVRIKIIHLRCYATKSADRKPLPRLDYSREAAILSCCTGASQHHSGGTSKKLSRLLVLPLDQTNLAAIDSQPITQVTSHQRASPPSGTGQAAGQNGRHRPSRHGGSRQRRHPIGLSRHSIACEPQDAGWPGADTPRRHRCQRPCAPRLASLLRFRVPAGLPAD